MSLGSVLGSIFAPKQSNDNQQPTYTYRNLDAYAAISSPYVGVRLSIEAALNANLRHARIGKITLKAAA